MVGKTHSLFHWARPPSYVQPKIICCHKQWFLIACLVFPLPGWQKLPNHFLSKTTWLNSSYSSFSNSLWLYTISLSNWNQGVSAPNFNFQIVLEKTKVKRINANSSAIRLAHKTSHISAFQMERQYEPPPAISNAHEAIGNFCFVKPYTSLEGEQLDWKEIWDNPPSSPSSADNQMQQTKKYTNFVKPNNREEQLEYK